MYYDDLRSGVKNINLEEIVPFHEAMVGRASRLGLTKDSLRMRRNMASLYKLKGQKDDAIKELELACKEYPDSFAPIKDLSLLQEPQEALTLLQEFINRKGYNNIHIFDKLFYAEALLRAGERQEAKGIAQEIVKALSLDSHPGAELRQARSILEAVKMWENRRT